MVLLKPPEADKNGVLHTARRSSIEPFPDLIKVDRLVQGDSRTGQPVDLLVPVRSVVRDTEGESELRQVRGFIA